MSGIIKVILILIMAVQSGMAESEIDGKEPDFYRGIVLQEDGSLMAYYETFGTAYEA